MNGCAFLPLTTDTAARLCSSTGDDETGSAATRVRSRAQEVEATAARCWTILLAGCDTPLHRELASRLRGLSEATVHYAGRRWWFAEGSVHRLRVAGAQARIESALADADGGEFARAFVGYDHAMASAVVCARRPVPAGGRDSGG